MLGCSARLPIAPVFCRWKTTDGGSGSGVLRMPTQLLGGYFCYFLLQLGWWELFLGFEDVRPEA